MLLDENLNGNDVEASNHKRMALSLDLRVVGMSDVVNNNSLRNETKSLLREVCVECGVILHNYNQSKLKVKEVEIAVQNSSTEYVHDDLGWLEDDSDDEEVDNAPAEEVESKLRTSLEKEFKKYLKMERIGYGNQLGR